MKGFAIKDIVVSLLINVGIPLLIIYTLTTHIHTSEFIALSVASIVPIGYSIFEVVRDRRLDLISIFFLLGIVTNIVAILLGGNVRLLIIRESFFSGALGLACFISLLLHRPLMFYVGRQMLAGNDPARLATYNATWEDLATRAGHRLITTVWGAALLGEFIVRVIIAYTLPTTTAYALGTAIFTIVLASTFAWTFAYIRIMRQRAIA